MAEQSGFNAKMAEQMEQLEKRMDHLERATQENTGALNQLALSAARMEGALQLMKFTIPIVVAIGGVTVAVIALFK